MEALIAMLATSYRADLTNAGHEVLDAKTLLPRSQLLLSRLPVALGNDAVAIVLESSHLGIMSEKRRVPPNVALEVLDERVGERSVLASCCTRLSVDSHELCLRYTTTIAKSSQRTVGGRSTSSERSAYETGDWMLDDHGTILCEMMPR